MRWALAIPLSVSLLGCTQGGESADSGGVDDSGGEAAGVDDTGEAEVRGIYERAFGFWEGQFEQAGFGTYYASFDFQVTEAEEEQEIGLRTIMQWAGTPYCVHQGYHDSQIDEDSWMIQVMEIEDPSSACGSTNNPNPPDFDSDGDIYTFLDEDTIYVEESAGTTAGLLYRVDL